MLLFIHGLALRAGNHILYQDKFNSFFSSQTLLLLKALGLEPSTLRARKSSQELDPPYRGLDSVEAQLVKGSTDGRRPENGMVHIRNAAYIIYTGEHVNASEESLKAMYFSQEYMDAKGKLR